LFIKKINVNIKTLLTKIIEAMMSRKMVEFEAPPIIGERSAFELVAPLESVGSVLHAFAAANPNRIFTAVNISDLERFKAERYHPAIKTSLTGLVRAVLEYDGSSTSLEVRHQFREGETPARAPHVDPIIDAPYRSLRTLGRWKVDLIPDSEPTSRMSVGRLSTLQYVGTLEEDPDMISGDGKITFDGKDKPIGSDMSEVFDAYYNRIIDTTLITANGGLLRYRRLPGDAEPTGNYDLVSGRDGYMTISPGNAIHREPYVQPGGTLLSIR